MKEIIKWIRNNILDWLLKHNFIVATSINAIILWLFYGNLLNAFLTEKAEILNMLISISGTLFGFILTFLSVFIIFRTEEKYMRNTENENKPLIMLINNDSFNDMYELFIKSSYALGMLLIVSIVLYFIPFNISIINFIGIVLIFELILLCIIRVFLSIYTFNTLIRILIQGNNRI